MDLSTIIMTVVLMVGLFVMTTILAMTYKRCGPSEALIVSGGSPKPMIIVGGGTIVLPLIQKAERLSLELMSIEMKSTATFPSKEKSLYDFDGILETSVDSDTKSIETASQYFLGKEIKEIRSQLYDLAQDCVRSVTAERSEHELLDLNTFKLLCEDSLGQALRSYGLKVHSLRIREMRKVKDHVALLNTREEVPLMPVMPVMPENGNDCAGRLAIVTKSSIKSKHGADNETISNGMNQAEITLGIDNASTRKTVMAVNEQPGMPLTEGDLVVIKSIEAKNGNKLAVVEPWSNIHKLFPGKSIT